MSVHEVGGLGAPKAAQYCVQPTAFQILFFI
jgi:hypothetical protein